MAGALLLGLTAAAVSLSAIASSAIASPAASPDVRWIAYIRAPGEAHDTGSLHVVRSDGKDRRMLIDGGVIAVDVGPSGEVFAAREVSGAPDAPTTSALVRVPVDGGEPVTVGGDEGAFYLSVAVSTRGEVAFFRQVNRPSDPPEFLEPAIPKLSGTTVPVLVPEDPPAGAGGLVTDAGQDFYQVLFTNDPKGELAHAEQVNVLVSGSLAVSEAPGDGVTPARVRGADGEFFCGASACFLTWEEFDATYTVGEFGAPEDAIAFAESLVPIDETAGPFWRDGADYPVPELVARGGDGDERTIESAEGFCECSFTPLAWSPDGNRLLVLTSAEGYTTLQEYPAGGSGKPSTVAEGSVFGDAGGVILDAGYGPRGMLLVVGGEGGPPGRLQTENGRRLADGVRAFDSHGSTLAYVTAAGDVQLRDLRTGTERLIAEGAIDVSVAPDPLKVAVERPAPPPPEGGLSVWLVVSTALAALAAAIGWVLRSRRRG